MRLRYRATLSKKWSAPAQGARTDLALTAQVEQLKSSKPKQAALCSCRHHYRLRFQEGSKHNQSPEWAWKNVMPKDAEPTIKDFRGKHYHLTCQFLIDGVCHTTEDCSKNPDTYANTSTAAASTSATDKGEKKTGSRRLRPPSQPLPLEEDEDNEAESETSDFLNGRLKALHVFAGQFL
jgi:hypothetical protein